MKVRINSTNIQTRSGNKNGRDWTMRNQKAMCQVGNEVREIQILIPADSSAYAPGDYEIDFEKSCYVNAFGTLNIGGEIKLKAVSSVKAA